MAPESAPLQIHIHLVDGNVLRYEQHDPIAKEAIIKNLQPTKVFDERQIMIAGGYTVTGYSTSAVVRVDLMMEGLPEFRFGPEMANLSEITKDDFNERYRPEEGESLKRKRPWTVGETFSGLAELELLNGTSIFLEFETTLRSKLDQRLVLQHFLSGSGLYCRRHGGGASFINTATVVRWTLFPGPPEAPQNAWIAHFTGAKKIVA